MQQAQEMAQSLNPSLESFSPKGFETLWPTMPKDVMDMMFGNTMNADGLNAKTRLLLKSAEKALSQIVRHAVVAGAKKQEIVETIGQMSVFAGIPAMPRAPKLAHEALEEQGDDHR